MYYYEFQTMYYYEFQTAEKEPLVELVLVHTMFPATLVVISLAHLVVDILEVMAGPCSLASLPPHNILWKFAAFPARLVSF